MRSTLSPESCSSGRESAHSVSERAVRADSRPLLRFIVASALVLFFSTSFLSFAATNDAKPNIILFLSDDHMATDCGAYGARDVRTPNIDRLAREGLRFKNAFAGSPTCMPSRSVLLTGLMPFRNGAHANNLGEQSRCRAGIRSLPHYLKELGYRVAQAGKMHYGPKQNFPFERIENSEMPEPGYETNSALRLDLKTDVVDKWLASASKTAPFCLIVCDNSPHVLWPRPPTYDTNAVVIPPHHLDTPGTRLSRARYYTDVTKMDSNLGHVLASLEKHGFASDAIVIYTTDQGAQWPLAKWNLYDEGLRVPFIVRWPGKVQPATITDAMISLVDVLPTFMEIAGGKALTDLDGKSFLPVLEGKTGTQRDFIFATHSQDGEMNLSPMRCVRGARYKLILNLAPQIKYTTHIDRAKDHDGGREYWDEWVEKAKGDPRAAALLQRYHWRPKEELYDVLLDPYEVHNLAEDAAYADLKADLNKQLAVWRKQQQDFKTGPDPLPAKTK